MKAVDKPAARKRQKSTKNLQGRRWKPLTKEFQELSEKAAPRTPGRGGAHIVMHQIAMKLAEMMMRPDIYGKEVVKELAAQWGMSVRRVAELQKCLTELARNRGLYPTIPDKLDRSPLTPKQIKALLQEMQIRVKREIKK